MICVRVNTIQRGRQYIRESTPRYARNSIFYERKKKVREKTLKNNVTNTIFYDKIIKTNNAAFSVGVSFLWDSFIRSNLKRTATGLIEFNEWKTLVVTTVYAVVTGLVFSQFGLFLIDLRAQRLHEVHLKNIHNESTAGDGDEDGDDACCCNVLYSGKTQMYAYLS